MILMVDNPDRTRIRDWKPIHITRSVEWPLRFLEVIYMWWDVVIYVHLSNHIEWHLHNFSLWFFHVFLHMKQILWYFSAVNLTNSVKADNAIVRALITWEVTGFQKRKQSFFVKISNILFPFWTAFISRHLKSFWFSFWTVLLKEIQRNLEIELSLNGDCIRFSTLDIGKISQKTQTWTKHEEDYREAAKWL